MAPVLLPAFSFGLALLIAYTKAGLALSPLTIIIGHTVVCAPFVMRAVMSSAAQLGSNFTEASLSLGASHFTTYRRITLPLVRSGMAAGAFMAFMLSFDNVPISLFVSDARTEMLPIRLWYLIFYNLDVRAAAVAGALIILTFAGVVLMERASGLTRTFR
jgi:putative spermidine/putrescine transport system permease protein